MGRYIGVRRKSKRNVRRPVLAVEASRLQSLCRGDGCELGMMQGAGAWLNVN